MSPIFVRPVREQLEHDRLIRFLQTKYKRKLEATVNPGDEQVAPVKIGPGTFFPDMVLMDGKRLAGLVEVETGESVNNLEAMAQWVHFSRARVPFHLYVPVQAYDVARRLSEANDVRVNEIWTYRATSDGFDLVRMFHDSSSASPSAASKHKSSAAAAQTKGPAHAVTKPRKAAPAKKTAKKPARPLKKLRRK